MHQSVAHQLGKLEAARVADIGGLQPVVGSVSWVKSRPAKPWSANMWLWKSARPRTTGFSGVGVVGVVQAVTTTAAPMAAMAARPRRVTGPG